MNQKSEERSMNRQSWVEVFKSMRNYSWHCNRWKSYALELPGYRLQSYFAWCNAYITSRYLVNVYVGKNDIMQEVLYKKSKGQDYIPISPKAFHNLFPNLQFLEVKEAWGHGNEWWKYLEVVEFEQGNRILFKFKMDDWRKMAWGVNLDNIAYTFAGMMIRKFGHALAIACLYPDTIKNLDDAANVMDVIHSLSMLSYRRNGYYEKEIESFRNKLKEESKKIGDYNAQFDLTCNGAADAMNILSEKFGIVVNV